MVAKEIDDIQQQKESLMMELSDLTNVLKKSTTKINETVKLQNQQLGDIQFHAMENDAELHQQRQKVKVILCKILE